MKNQLATALALALVAGAMGLAVVPLSAASHNNCHRDFEIAEDKASASTRSLVVNELEIGRAEVAAGTPEDLMVDLRTAGADLSVNVFQKDVLGECVAFDQQNCSKTISTTGDQLVCQLDAPASGTEFYWVHYENVGDETLEYLSWTPSS